MHLFLALLPFRNFFLRRLIAAPRVNGCGTEDGHNRRRLQGRIDQLPQEQSRTVSFESGSRFLAFDANATDPAFAEIAGRME
jgi:hypothetical protein